MGENEHFCEIFSNGLRDNCIANNFNCILAQSSQANNYMEFPLDMTIKRDNGNISSNDLNGFYVHQENAENGGFQYIHLDPVSDNTSVLNDLHYVYYSNVPESDCPEFINIDDLKIINGYQDLCLNKGISRTVEVPASLDPLQNNVPGNITETDSNDVIKVSSDSDEDVVFVTMYSKTATTTTSTYTASKINETPKKPKIIRRRRKKRNVVVPRRNPKRTAQLEKASVDLAMKLSVPNSIFNAKVLRNGYGSIQRNCRQSCRTTGAILSPPSPLTNKDWKEWPAKGIDDKPVYNPEQDPEKIFSEKNSSSENLSEFAVATHETLHALLDYVPVFKKYHEIVNPKKNSDHQENLEKIAEILSDTCKLYVIANDVEEENLVKYISNLI